MPEKTCPFGWETHVDDPGDEDGWSPDYEPDKYTLTRVDYGCVDPKLLLGIPGRKGEHWKLTFPPGRYTPEKWQAMVDQPLARCLTKWRSADEASCMQIFTMNATSLQAYLQAKGASFSAEKTQKDTRGYHHYVTDDGKEEIIVAGTKSGAYKVTVVGCTC